MFIPDKMKLNKFKLVSMPSARDYFSLTGFQDMPASSYTGDEAAPMPQNKVDAINDWMDYADSKAREAESKQNNPKNE